MSRIHEALQKARRHEPGFASEIPNIEEMIANRTSDPEPKGSDVSSKVLPISMLDPEEEQRTPEQQSATLPSITSRNWPIQGSQLVFLSDSEALSGQEQFRTLRSRLYQMRRAGSLQVIAVSSAVPHEGKSFVSANLTHAFALQSEGRVVVIDGDLRRAGGLSSVLEAPTSPGLSEYLLGKEGVDRIIQSGSLGDNFCLIPCGTQVPNSGELIGSARFSQLIQQLRRMFDWIVIDTPPVVPIVDARTIAEAADGVLLVVSAHSTHADLAKRAMQEFRRDSLLGVVLNRAKHTSTSYYAYGYGYYPNDRKSPVK